MKIKLGYDYKTVCGIFKLGVCYENSEEKKSNVQISINNNIFPLNFSFDFVQNNDSVFFGVNTYKFSNKANYILKIDLLSDNKVLDTLEISCLNDPHLQKSIQKSMESLPSLIPLPLDRSLFSQLPNQIFNSPYFEEGPYDSFREDGFIILKNFYPTDLMQELCNELDLNCEKKYMGYEEGSSMRLEQLHRLGGKFTELFQDKKIREYLFNLYGVEMLPCQSLGYKYGSQQGTHSDFVHLTAYPENLMCGVWVALEDVVVGSGELEFFPGSHKEKRLYMSDFGLSKVTNADYSFFGKTFENKWKELSKKYTPSTALLNRGDVLIWDGNLLHGGLKREKMEIPRRSVVFHFFGTGAPCYYDSTGEIGFAGELLVTNN
jgi:hypothetical protein